METRAGGPPSRCARMCATARSARTRPDLSMARRDSNDQRSQDQAGDHLAPASFLTIEERASSGDELKEDIVVADIGSKHNQAELLRLQEQHAVL